MIANPVKHRFTVAEYHQMGRAGIFGEDDRVELIDGEVFHMTPIGPLHADCVDSLARVLFERLRRRALVRVQNPIHAGPRSEPQPDLSLLKPRPGGYAKAHPRPQDVLLVIEVSDTTARTDREVKIPLYARAAIAEAWLVDLPAQVIEVYRGPHPHGYAHLDLIRRGDRLTIAAFPDCRIDVAEIVG